MGRSISPMEEEPVAGSDPRAAPRLIVPMSLQLVIPRRVALQQSSPPLHQPSVILKEKRNFEKEKLLNCMCNNSKLSQQKGSPHTTVLSLSNNGSLKLLTRLFEGHPHLGAARPLSSQTPSRPLRVKSKGTALNEVVESRAGAFL